MLHIQNELAAWGKGVVWWSPSLQALPWVVLGWGLCCSLFRSISFFSRIDNLIHLHLLFLGQAGPHKVWVWINTCIADQDDQLSLTVSSISINYHTYCVLTCSFPSTSFRCTAHL
ncbi:hypothetical protein EGW08_011494, partial [Elysia chlorotica]